MRCDAERQQRFIHWCSAVPAFCHRRQSDSLFLQSQCVYLVVKWKGKIISARAVCILSRARSKHQLLFKPVTATVHRTWRLKTKVLFWWVMVGCITVANSSTGLIFYHQNKDNTLRLAAAITAATLSLWTNLGVSGLRRRWHLAPAMLMLEIVKQIFSN